MILNNRMSRVLAALFCLAVLLALTATATQAGGCAHPYLVQPGDTLTAIAQRHGSTVQELARLNGLRNPNLIYFGRTLCLPGPAVEAAIEVGVAASPPQRAIVLEAIYTEAITPSLSLEPAVHARLILSEGENGFQSVGDSTALRNAISDTAALVFWVTRPKGAPAYVLVSVGPDEPLGMVRPEASLAQPLVQPLVQPGKTASLVSPSELKQPMAGKYLGGMTIWLEASTGERYPLPIAAIGRAATVKDARSSYPDGYLAILADGPNRYRAVAVVGPESIFGPPGLRALERCDWWAGRSGWLYAWLRAMNGCPR